MKNKIFGSATKTVLIMMVFALCIFTYLKIVSGDDFKTALLMVLSFYFGAKNPQPTQPTQPTLSPSDV